MFTYTRTEEEQELIDSESNLAIVQRNLKLNTFKELDSEVQVSTITEAGNLLRSKLVRATDKRRLINFLQAIATTSTQIETEVNEVLDWWNSNPF